MGSDNQGIWKQLKLSCSKQASPVVSINHPHIPTAKLHFTPDVPHVLKNLRNNLTNGHDIQLSAKTVSKYNLPTARVDMSHVISLHAWDKNNITGKKLAPNLTERHLNPSHHDKMRVNLAKQLFDKPVSAGINLLVKAKELPVEAVTTAWFINQISYFV